MVLTQDIVRAIDSPRELEALYRDNPDEFGRVLPELFSRHPESIALQVWYQRLFFKEPSEVPAAEASRGDTWNWRGILLTVTLSLVAGTLVKIPDLFRGIDDEWFYSRNVAIIIAMALMAYFWSQRRCPARVIAAILGVALVAVLYLNLLPDRSASDTILLASLHMPLFFWSLLGVSFLAGRWQDYAGRMDYIRYNGELVIYTTIILIGGMVLTGITLALFELIDADDFQLWYLRNVVVYGAVASPIVATWLVDQVLGNRLNIAPLLARVFTPLFLITVVIYLVVMLLGQKSPYTDRDFLITFNGLLLLVLALSIFSASERAPGRAGGFVDSLNIALVAVTLMVDVVALSAILFRLTSYGLTPNRIAVLGANLLAFGHLAGILYYYVQLIRRGGDGAPLEGWIVRYLPAYAMWSAVVAFGFPLVFALK